MMIAKLPAGRAIGDRRMKNLRPGNASRPGCIGILRSGRATSPTGH